MLCVANIVNISLQTDDNKRFLLGIQMYEHDLFDNVKLLQAMRKHFRERALVGVDDVM